MNNDLDKDNRALKSITIISVALLYFLLAQLGDQISFVAYSSQLLSLDDGFALAVMLTMARSRALLGIALGAILLSLYQIFEFGHVDIFMQLVIPVCFILIQAYINLIIYRKWISHDNNLSRNTDLFRFLTVIPIIAVVNTLFSLLLYQWLALADQVITVSDWIKIWMGHTASLSLIIPVVLSIIERKNALWASRKKILVFNFGIFVIIVFLVCSNISDYENNRLEERFKVIANQATTLFQSSLKEKELLQRSVAQLIESSKEVTRTEFKQFVHGLSLDNKYIQVVEWLPKIKSEQRLDYEKLQSEFYNKKISITQSKTKGQTIPATEQEVYYPITYLEPERDNNAEIGYDFSGTFSGKRLINKAITTGESQAGEPLKIMRNGVLKHAFIIYQPVYKNLDEAQTFILSSDEVLGFVSIVIRVDDFIATIVGPTETANFNLQWQDTETGQYYFDSDIQESAPFEHVINFDLSGREMKLIFTPTSTFIEQAATQTVTIVILASFILASLFSMLMLSITGLTSQIKSEVKLRTQELEELNKRLELLSNKDVLTELFNRRYFERALQDEFERSLRYNVTFALIMFDIDNFKEINDQYGHPCGDKVIEAIAAYLIRMSRSSDVPARVGGEEFALILPRQSEAHVMDIVERMRIDISNIEVKHDEHIIQFTCSFGIAIFDEKIKDTHMLVKMTDQAMYKAKEAGKNRTELFTESSKHAM